MRTKQLRPCVVLDEDLLGRVSGGDGEDEGGAAAADAEATTDSDPNRLFDAASAELHAGDFGTQGYDNYGGSAPSGHQPSFVQYENYLQGLRDNGQMTSADEAMVGLVNTLGRAESGQAGVNRVGAAMDQFDGLAADVRSQVSSRFDDYLNHDYMPRVINDLDQRGGTLASLGRETLAFGNNVADGFVLGSYAPDRGVASSIGQIGSYFVAPEVAAVRDLSHAGLEAIQGNYGQAALETAAIAAPFAGRMLTGAQGAIREFSALSADEQIAAMQFRGELPMLHPGKQELHLGGDLSRSQLTESPELLFRGALNGDASFLGYAGRNADPTFMARGPVGFSPSGDPLSAYRLSVSNLGYHIWPVGQ